MKYHYCEDELGAEIGVFDEKGSPLFCKEIVALLNEGERLREICEKHHICTKCGEFCEPSRRVDGQTGEQMFYECDCQNRKPPQFKDSHIDITGGIPSEEHVRRLRGD